jgi:autotransporter-associated beta strand protein
LGRIIFCQAAGDLILRAADGSSRSTAINVGAGGGGTASSGSTILVDFSGHDADILVSSLNVGNQPRTGTQGYEFKFGAGDHSLASKLDVTNVSIGFRAGATSTTAITTSRVNLSGGTVMFGNVSGTGTGVDIGNSSYAQTGAAGIVGELNISGGSVTLHNSNSLGAAVRLGTNVVAGGGTVTASMNLSGGATTLGGDIIRNATSPRTASTVKISGGTLDMGGNNLGTATELITLTAESGTLQNVATINGTGGLTKTTAGTLTISGSNTYSGATTVTDGTLVLGATNVLPDSSAVSIGAATLNAATAGIEDAGTLAVTAAATINLAAGAQVEFDASNAISWPGTLNLTGTFVSGTSLKFGTSNTALTSIQLGKISATGFTGFGLTNSGYLTAIPDGFASWITGTFTNGQVPLDKRGANDDPDNDGISNLVEYAIAGQDPTVGNPVISTFSGGTLSFTKAAGTNGLTYAIQESTDLTTWTEVTGGSYVNNEISSTISFTLTPGTPAKQFLRLQVLSN